MTIGMAVPIERRSRNDDVFPGKKRRERVENRKAERPKPDMTIPVTVARSIGDEFKWDKTEERIWFSPLYLGMSSPSS